MEIFDKYWLTTGPFDYELKYYKLLAAIKEIDSLVAAKSLYTAIREVELQLEKLYSIKYNKDLIELKHRKITGIDIDNMELAYEYNETSDDLQVIYDICDTAIEVLEKTYRNIRDKWRELETKCAVTEIPDKKPSNTMGYIMYIVPDSPTIKIYKYIEPTSFKIDWNKFKLIEVCEIKNELRAIATFIAQSESNTNAYRFFRFDVKIKTELPPFDECMLPLMKYSIFNRIKHGI